MGVTPSPQLFIGFYFLGYLVITGGAFVTTSWILRGPFRSRRLSTGATSGQIWHELKYSLQSQFIYGLLTLFVFQVLAPNGWLRIYLRVEERGTAWYVASYVLVLFLHDAYFYWTHRWMHHPKFFEFFHLLHHESVHPTPFTAHAFEIPEGIVQGLFFVLIAAFLPLHWAVIPVFFTLSMANNVYGHFGYDLIGELKHRFPFTYLNDPCSHGWHHLHVRGNYSVYFNFWDRIMGTWRGHLEATPGTAPDKV